MPQTGSPFEWRKRKFTVSLVNWSGYLSLREKLSWVHWETHHKEISGEKIQHRLVCGGPRGQPRDWRGVGFSLVDEWLRQTGRLGVQALETPKDPIQATSWNMVSLHTPGHKHRRHTEGDFLTVLEAGCGEHLPPGLQTALFSVNSQGLSATLCTLKRGLSPSSSSCKAPNPIRLGPHPENSFNLNYLLQALSSNTVGLGDWGFSMEAGGTQLSPQHQASVTRNGENVPQQGGAWETAGWHQDPAAGCASSSWLHR